MTCQIASINNMLKLTSLTYINALIARHQPLLPLKDSIISACEAISNSHNNGRKVLVCGNGGSAADAEHIVGELMKEFLFRRDMPESDIELFRDSGIEDWEHFTNTLQPAIRAIALTQHPALSSAMVNDRDPYMVFAQQVYGYGKKGDILLAISTSGTAKNVINAIKTAKVLGLVNIGLTGGKPSPMDSLCDILIKAPETQTYRIQELHQPIYHCICMVVEEELFG